MSPRHSCNQRVPQDPLGALSPTRAAGSRCFVEFVHAGYRTAYEITPTTSADGAYFVWYTVNLEPAKPAAAPANDSFKPKPLRGSA